MIPACEGVARSKDRANLSISELEVRHKREDCSPVQSVFFSDID